MEKIWCRDCAGEVDPRLKIPLQGGPGDDDFAHPCSDCGRLHWGNGELAFVTQGDQDKVAYWEVGKVRLGTLLEKYQAWNLEEGSVEVGPSEQVVFRIVRSLTNIRGLGHEWHEIEEDYPENIEGILREWILLTDGSPS